MRKYFYLSTLFFLTSSFLQAQCPASFTCQGSYVFCNVNQMNGVICSNFDFPNPSFPTLDLCYGVGAPHNIGWWAFVGNNSAMSITINYGPSSCQQGGNGFGIQAGIFEGDCAGTTILDCSANCDSQPITLSGYIRQCNTYFLWIDGCNGDVCTFTWSVIAGPGGGTLPRPMPRPIALNTPCVCGEAEIVFPGYSGGCVGNISWEVNGQPYGVPGDDRIYVDFPDESPIEVCVKSVLGTTSYVCDEDSSCILIRPNPIPRIQGQARKICFEDQPFEWHGQPITQSCVNPPCSARFTLPNGCCIDSLVPFELLPLPSIGRQEVFYCSSPPDIPPHRSQDGRAWSTDVCGELVEFQHPITGCDTSIYLDVRYFQFSKAALASCPPCSGSSGICPYVVYTPDCLEFEDDRVEILLEWYRATDSVLLDTLDGRECFHPNHVGRYCYNMYVAFAFDTCYIENVCIDYDTTIFEIPKVYKISCDSDRVSFAISDTVGICSAEWAVDTGFVETKGMFGDTLSLTFPDGIPDSVFVTLYYVSDCLIDTLSAYYNLVEEARRDTLVVCTSDLPYFWNNQRVDSSTLLSKRAIVNGCVVDSIRYFEVADDSIIGRIDTTICVVGGDTNYYVDPNGQTWKHNESGVLIDLGGSHRCDSLFELFLSYHSVAALPVVDTLICGFQGEQLDYRDPFGNVFTQPQDSILIYYGRGCDSAYLLNLRFLKIGYDWEADCSCSYECVKIDPHLTFSDTNVRISYHWLDSGGDTISSGDPVLYTCVDDVHCLYISIENGKAECLTTPLCEPINESVLVPKATLNYTLTKSKKPEHYFEIKHNGVFSCLIQWYSSFVSSIEYINPQRTKVKVEPVGKVSGRQEVCVIHQFSCGARDTLCQTIYFKSETIERPRDP